MYYALVRYSRSVHTSAALLLLLLLQCSKSGDEIAGIDESKDHTAPAAIADLVVTGITGSSVSLRWTATGDDIDSGTAAEYDLRYYRSMITNENWDAATVVSSMAKPSAPGVQDSVAVQDLQADSSYWFAIKAGDELDNWSGLSNVASATCIDNVDVAFPDTVLERVIRFYIDKPDGDIRQLDLLTLGWINAWNQRIHDLSGLEYCRNLAELRLSNNSIVDLAPLSRLSNLRVLDVSINQVIDIGPLAPLENLDTLRLNSNEIVDISALEGMTSLEFLNLSYNEIWDLSALAGNESIGELGLDGNQITFVNALYSVTGLERLRLNDNLIDDLLPLAYNMGLGTGDTIWLEGNPLGAASTDSLVSVIQGRGVTVIR